MYIKRMDLLGFKSFTEKTKIEIDKGISCIVGPNGSGKSNVSDALRWVLGEQRVGQLRGNKMEDVIFAGSQKRKALGLAEVTITFDNSDGYLSIPFVEVAVTRRAYRSGESEYLINNNVCRLKDVYNLFVDTGIGRDGISIVGQGKVQEIVAVKPEERRSLVEDAAGIVKYRNRKKESLKKLDETKRHLERIGDILLELAGRVPVLQEQAEIAGKYVALSTEADNLEIALAVNVLTITKDKLAVLNHDLLNLENHVFHLEAEKAKIDAEVESLAFAVNTLDETVVSLQAEIHSLHLTEQEIQAETAVLHTKQDGLQENSIRLDREQAELQQQEVHRLEQVAGLTQEQQEIAAAIQEKTAVIFQGEDGQETQKQAIQQTEAALVEVKNELFDLANSLAHCRNELHYQQQLLDNQMQNGDKLKQQAQEMTVFAADLLMKEKQMQQQLEDNQEKQKKLSQTIDGKLLEQNKQDQLVSDVELKYTEIQFKLHGLKSRVTMMEELAQSYEGYFPGVKAVLLAKKQQHLSSRGIIGVVAELLQVEDQYSVAIEMVLGGSLQNIITATEKDAKNAIRYLKETKAGRATFLPLDIIQHRKNKELDKVLALPGVCGRAADLVGCVATVRAGVEFLLDNILVVDNMDTAVIMAGKTGYRFNIVTLDGDMVKPGGALTGGSRRKNNNNLLSRQIALAEGQKQLASVAELSVSYEQQLQIAKITKNRIAADLAQLILEGKELENWLDLQKRDLEQNITAQQLSCKQLEVINLEQEQLNQESQAIQSQKESGQQNLLLLETRNTVLMQEMAQLQSELMTLQSVADTDKEGIIEQRLTLARMEEKLHSVTASLKQLTAQGSDIAGAVQAKEAAIQEIEADRIHLKNSLACNQERIVALQKAYHLQESGLAAKRHELLAANAQIDELRTGLKALNRSLEESKQSQYQQEIKKARLESDWDNETTKLTDKFNLSYQQAIACQQIDLSGKEMTMRLHVLKNDMKALGNINMTAIAEYAEVKERYDFLTAQNNDLLEARKSLDAVIAEMDEIMSVRFRQAFNSLNTEFNFVFKRLFGGGEAALILTDPDNMLETGVDIQVMPPGKKVANYNLLSGGEKTMIGIALIFAVLKVRPVPFCVMDEIDAALDEANVERFANYLAEFSKSTQFIMISHRQGTMLAAGNLWGVTMEEEGISKVISVKLTDVGKVS